MFMIAADTAITVVELVPPLVTAAASIPVPTLAAATAPSVKRMLTVNVDSFMDKSKL